MWGIHLKKKGSIWHYYGAVPKGFADVEAKQLISFTLKTTDFTEAKRRAAEISHRLENDWKDAVERGVSLQSQCAAERYSAAVEVQLANGFEARQSTAFNDEELIARLRHLLLNQIPNQDQAAVLGIHDAPEFSLGDAFDRFWDYIKDGGAFH